MLTRDDDLSLDSLVFRVLLGSRKVHTVCHIPGPPFPLQPLQNLGLQQTMFENAQRHACGLESTTKRLPSGLCPPSLHCSMTWVGTRVHRYLSRSGSCHRPLDRFPGAYNTGRGWNDPCPVAESFFTSPGLYVSLAGGQTACVRARVSNQIHEQTIFSSAA